jgi:hypothetical protein
MSSNARMRLKELCDKNPGWKLTYEYPTSSGPDHQRLFSTDVCVRDAGNKLRLLGTSGHARSLKEAQEQAAEGALLTADLGDLSVPEEVRTQAWCGDATQEFVLALLASKAGLSAAQQDDISQALFSNAALAAAAPVQLVSVSLTSTEAEAALGRVVAQSADALLAILLPALNAGNPPLAAALQAAVAARAQLA